MQLNTNTISAAQSAVRSSRGRVWKWIVAGIGALLFVVLAGVGFMFWRMSYVPADLDLSTTRLSNAGLYRVSYTPRRGPIPINQLHTWTIHVATADGLPLTDGAISIDGDMPQHGHGLPTRPQVTRHLGNGDYLVEGLKFQMGGWWVVDFTIDAHGKTDTVRFNMILK